MFCLIVIQISHAPNVTLQIAQQVTTQTTMKTHQTYQHNTTVPLRCVSKYGNKMPLILLTTVVPICKMVKPKTYKNSSKTDKKLSTIIKQLKFMKFT